MLLNFRVENYKSIKGLETLSLEANKKLTDHNETLINVGKRKILPVLSIYGANASGKSNIIKAMKVMKNIVTSNSTNELKGVVPFIYDEKCCNKPTFFEVELLNEHTLKAYRYGFTCDKENIYEEWLYLINEGKKEDEGIFFRDNVNNEFAFNEKFSSNSFKELIDFTNNITTNNDLLMNPMLKKYSKDNKDIINCEESLLHTLHEYFSGGLIYFNQDSSEMQDESFLNHIFNNVSIFNKASMKFLQDLDPTIKSIERVEKKDEDLNEKFDIIITRESFNHKKVKTNLSIESAGTKKMLLLYPLLSLTLEIGDVIIIDEIDIKLHPLLFRKIVKMFTNKEINKNGAQIIFSSHSTICLDSSDLRRDSIIFVEKKSKNNTIIYPLSTVKHNNETIRSDYDYGKNYLLGRFGSIPFSEE